MRAGYRLVGAFASVAAICNVFVLLGLLDGSQSAPTTGIIAEVGPVSSEPRESVADTSVKLAATETDFCGSFPLESIHVQVGAARSEAQRASFRSQNDCLIEVRVDLADQTSADSVACKLDVIFVEPSDEFKGRPGVSFWLAPDDDASCAAFKSTASVTLPPLSTKTRAGGGLAGRPTMSTAFNPWTYHHLIGKITGQDPVNIDMIWNRPHLVWWEDGITADYGSWWEDDGDDPFWGKTNSFTWYNTTQHNVNNFFVTHQRDFHSDGLPPAYRNVNAWTSMTLTGYYNGYATCGNFSHNYDSGAQWYFYLHWHNNECYWGS